ncbi:GDSL-type esterase/lipase family protein [Streptococcus ferus]|uniref:GDSL-type esterase/lipase family protein n=1 Tax=Streptococcus ferus TaxID=1345 RepID=UPI002353CB77|nr:GDSL-type esterase/lipase family protein [Streptococcus ferus]
MTKKLGFLFLLILCLGAFLFILPKTRVKSSEKITIAAVGDSITYGLGVGRNRKTLSYPALLAKKLGSRYDVINYGLSGRTMLSTANFPYFKEKAAADSLKSQANIVLIMLGTNDSKKVNWNADQYQTDYQKAIRRYQQMSSHPKIILMIPPRCFISQATVTRPNNRVIKEEIRHIIPQLAKKMGCQVIDLYALTQNHPDWFADGVHPNKHGNKAIAQLVYQTIKTDS